jgi:hypothetical protein
MGGEPIFFLLFLGVVVAAAMVLIELGIRAWSPSRHPWARREMAAALACGAVASALAALWWLVNYRADLSPLNVLLFGFVPGVLLGATGMRIWGQLAQRYGKHI